MRAFVGACVCALAGARALVRQLHDGMSATVLDNGDTSDSFPVTNGVKQGCVLALPSSA